MIKLNGYQIVLTHPTVCVKVKTTPTRPKFGSLGMVSISIICFAPFTQTAQSASMTGKLYFFYLYFSPTYAYGAECNVGNVFDLIFNAVPPTRTA